MKMVWSFSLSSGLLLLLRLPVMRLCFRRAADEAAFCSLVAILPTPQTSRRTRSNYLCGLCKVSCISRARRSVFQGCRVASPGSFGSFPGFTRLENMSFHNLRRFASGSSFKLPTSYRCKRKCRV
jgi:hypothetical protein